MVFVDQKPFFRGQDSAVFCLSNTEPGPGFEKIQLLEIRDSSWVSLDSHLGMTRGTKQDEFLKRRASQRPDRIGQHLQEVL